jgi:glycosyl transferase family 2
VTDRPDLAVVILSYRNEDTILDAVESLLAQDVALEIVVSHSGGGPTPALLADRHPSMEVVASSRRLLPGAARNAGVAASSAPYVAFLAADCVALPGWASGRLARHTAGAHAVGSALVPVHPSGPSLASFLLQHNSRMPHLTLPPHFRFGVSYSRVVLDRHGEFLETLRHGEDVAMNTSLLMNGVEIAWAADVVTAHHHPTSVAGLLADQYRRGRIRAALSGDRLWQAVSAVHVLSDAPAALWRASRAGSPVSSSELRRVAPLLFVGAIATAAGTVRGGLPWDPAAVGSANLRRRIRFARGRGSLARLWSRGGPQGADSSPE